jgi:hypothetical protein
MPTKQIEIGLSGGFVARFRSVDAASAWVEKEQARWAWFLDANFPNVTNVAQVADVRPALRQFFKDFGVRLDGAEEGMQGELNAIAQRLSPNGPILAPSPDAAALDLVRQRYSYTDQAAALAVASVVFANRIPGHAQVREGVWNFPPAVGGVALFEALRAGGTALAPAVTQQLARSEEALGDELQRNADAVDGFAARVAELETRAEALVSGLVDASAAARAELEKAAQAAIGTLEKTHTTYTEVMRLKAPVDYWSEKAAEHRAGISNYRWWLAGGSAVGVLALLGVYWGGFQALEAYARSGAGRDLTATVYIGGFVAAATGIVLWFLRIMVRLYLSQHHLAVDADERVAMLRTFLALSNEGKLGEADLALVLGAVFRPTPDGIVKDDGGPMGGLGAVLASAIDTRK